MCSGLTFAAWEATTIRNLINTSGVSIELLIGNADVLEPISLKKIIRPKSNILKRIVKRLIAKVRLIFIKIKRPLWQRYINYINKNFTADCDIKVDLTDELIDVNMLIVRAKKKGKYSQYFSESDVKKIKSCNLDLILRFGFNIIRGTILDVPTYGIWSFHHGDHLKYRGGPPGFWEIYYQDEWSCAILQKLTNKLDDGIILYRNKTKTDFSSYNNNKNQLFWNTVNWPSIVCKYILTKDKKVEFTKSTSSNAPIYTAPNNLQFLKYLYLIKKYRLKTKSHNTTTDKRELWALGIIEQPIEKLINTVKPPKIKWIEPLSGRFNADPFVIEYRKNSYIFFEDYDYQLEKGRISYIKTNDFTKFSKPIPILDKTYHLSYPFMVKDNKKYYCVPEQYSAGCVKLYEALNFPNEWVEKATLIDNFAGVDPTLIKYQNYWWMFIGNQKDNDSSKLYLFYTKKLAGPWIPHKNNPVKIFPNKIRPAGAIITLKGKLIRPSQNCSNTYGGNIIFYEIKELTIDNYKEQYIGELFPDAQSPYPDGLHHIVSSGNRTIIDGKRWI